MLSSQLRSDVRFTVMNCEQKEKKLECNIDGCNATFRKNCYLQIHLRKHSNERPFICDVPDCKKSYTNKWHLKRHKCFVHEKADEVICDVTGCGMVLSNKYSLKKHKQRNHSESSSNYSCSVCPQKFHKRWQLKHHFYSHSEEPAFKCTICNLGFKELHLYTKHNRNHKTYTCDCGEEFIRWTLFCEHRRNSCTVEKIDHKCIICNKIFTTKTNLKQHSLNVHLEESQNHCHRCPYLGCRRSYKFKKNLTSHILTYHEKVDILQIKCTEDRCEKVFKKQRYLKRHLIKMHKGAVESKITKKRAPRRDKGLPRKCMASVLSGVELSKEENMKFVKSAIQQNISEDCIENVSKETKMENDICKSRLSPQNTQILTEDGIDKSLPCQNSHDGSKVVTSDDLNSEDHLLQICSDIMGRIQDCLIQTPVQTIQETTTYCGIEA